MAARKFVIKANWADNWFRWLTPAELGYPKGLADGMTVQQVAEIYMSHKCENHPVPPDSPTDWDGDPEFEHDKYCHPGTGDCLLGYVYGWSRTELYTWAECQEEAFHFNSGVEALRILENFVAPDYGIPSIGIDVYKPSKFKPTHITNAKQSQYVGKLAQAKLQRDRDKRMGRTKKTAVKTAPKKWDVRNPETWDNKIRKKVK